MWLSELSMIGGITVGHHGSLTFGKTKALIDKKKQIWKEILVLIVFFKIPVYTNFTWTVFLANNLKASSEFTPANFAYFILIPSISETENTHLKITQGDEIKEVARCAKTAIIH